MESLCEQSLVHVVDVTANPSLGIRASSISQSLIKHHSSLHGSRDICRDGPSG